MTMSPLTGTTGASAAVRPCSPPCRYDLETCLSHLCRNAEQVLSSPGNLTRKVLAYQGAGTKRCAELAATAARMLRTRGATAATLLFSSCESALSGDTWLLGSRQGISISHQALLPQHTACNITYACMTHLAERMLAGQLRRSSSPCHVQHSFQAYPCSRQVRPTAAPGGRHTFCVPACSRGSTSRANACHTALDTSSWE